MGLRAALLPALTLTLLPLALALLLPTALRAQQLTLPAFTGYAHPDPNAIRRDQKTGAVFECRGELHFYFETKVQGQLMMSLRHLGDEPACELIVEVGLVGEPRRKARVGSGEGNRKPLMGMPDAAAGMQHVSVRMADGSPLQNVASLELEGPALAGAHASTVERRNTASIHLGYDVPAAHRDDIEWFYCELTPRTDPLWTYYMATGWHRGYFGMQVNSPTERRIIFSVWDSGNEGVDRNKVADEDRVQLIAKGEHVHASGFGNEGTGGHSHLKHDWKLGETFRFLVRAQPDGTHTTYTGWFWFNGEQRWQLIASFRAPKDGKHLRGLYSFDENFSGANGDLLRDCDFGNVWARTAGGEWLALTNARFTHDGHGKEQRLDRCAGVRDGRFHLRTGGFLPAPAGAVTAARAPLSVPAWPGKAPADDELPTLPAPQNDK